MGKSIGYVLSFIGVVFLALAVKPVKSNQIVLKVLPFLDKINNYILIGAGIIVLAIALIFLRKSSGAKQPPEVPIYEGKNVVGFRRMGKKRK